jgi:hypothetical protein
MIATVGFIAPFLDCIFVPDAGMQADDDSAT